MAFGNILLESVKGVGGFKRVVIVDVVTAVASGSTELLPHRLFAIDHYLISPALSPFFHPSGSGRNESNSMS